MSKRGWVIAAILVLLVFFAIKAYVHINNPRFSPIAGKFAGFSCSNTEGACKDKNLGGSCEVNGDTGVCTGSLTNDWKWNCKCTISKKSS
jgi:hypothetical protein